MKEEVKGGAGLTLLTFAVAMIACVVLLAQGAQGAEEVYAPGTLRVSMGAIDWEQVGFWLAIVVFGVDAVLVGKRFMGHRWEFRFGYTDQASFVKWLFTPWLERFESKPQPLLVAPDLKEFYVLLDGHNWHAAFEYPAPPEDVIQGSDAEYARLQQMAETSDAHRTLFDEFSLHMFSGDPWTKGRPFPKPVLAAC